MFVLQTATEDCCTKPVQNLLLPVYPRSLLHLFSQTGICESFVCVGWALKSNALVPSDAPVSPKQQKQVESSLVAASLCSVICDGLTPKLCLAGTMTTVTFNQSSVAFALYTVADLPVAYALTVADCVLSVMIWGQMPALSL